MKAAVLVSRDAALVAQLQRALAGALDLLPAESLARGVERSATLLVHVVLVDLGGGVVTPEELGQARSRQPQSFLVGLVRPAVGAEPPVQGVAECDLVIPVDLPDAALRAAVDKALRVHRLGRELAALRRERGRPEAPAPPIHGNGTSGSGSMGTALRELGKLLSTHFDIERVV